MASSSSSSSFSGSWKYDVFLSFRGEDTRKKFVDHFYKALKDSLIRTYKDDITLPRGESVRPALLQAIDESKIAVIVFSKSYADSSWCLDELVHIMKRRDEKGLIVMPVFYDVEPTEVRKQTGDFGKAFARLTKKNVNKANLWRKLFAKKEVENIIEAEPWRQTLVDASNISGWEPKNIANGHESAVIQNIVDTILEKLLQPNSDIEDDLVGMRARVQDLISSLDIGTGGVRMVGIWGIGGSGKTTLATSVYMKIKQHFEAHCFVDNIREESNKHKYSLKSLQEYILSTLLKTQVGLGVQNEEQGKLIIKDRLRNSNVLILLDDVDELKQLEALAGSHNWFGDGSRIIITTRDKHLLQKVDHVSPINLLSHDEALLLFHGRAYNEEKHVKGYETLSSQVVSYAAGLPLALRVLGSFLYDKNEKEWKSALDRLKKIPKTEILEQLKISYDGLIPVEKELFLDIACLLRGQSKDDVMEILEACEFYPDIGIRVLKQKALITVNSYGRFDMHDLIQDMAHFIVRRDYPNNPEKHSRVWKEEEIDNMCLGDTTMENDITEAIRYNVDCRSSHFSKIVSNMKKLRWLIVNKQNDDYVEGPTFLSNELRYISWVMYPASPFPDSFRPANLVVLKLYKSLQKELWNGHKLLRELKVLQLIRSKKLVSTPDFEGLPCLQKLELYECDDLEEIHPSLGKHKSLEYVDVSFCDKLRSFPTFVQMEKLETLQISWCHESLEFPEIQANMKSLVKMSLQGVGIQVLLLLIGERCTNLVSLYLVKCFISKRIEVNFDRLSHLQDFRFCCITRPRKIPLLLNEGRSLEPLQLLMSGTQVYISWLAFHQFTCSLQKLDISGCRLEDGEIPSDIAEISNLQELDLSSNDFSKLHFSLLQLTQLKLLNLTSCNQLVEFPELPSSIAIVIANRCDRLKSVGGFHTNFKFLCQVSLMNGRHLTDGHRLLQSMLQGKTNENHTMLLGLQGLEIPMAFRPRLRGGSECRLQLPENWCNDFCGFLMCAVLTNRVFSLNFSPRITMKQVTDGLMGMNSQHDVFWPESGRDKITWVGYVSFGSLRHTTWWDPSYSNISFSISMLTEPCSGFGVRLVSRKSGSDATETSRDSSEFSNDYTPKFMIVDDSTDAVNISLDFNLCR